MRTNGSKPRIYSSLLRPLSRRHVLVRRPFRLHFPCVVVRLKKQARLVVVGQRDAAHRTDQRFGAPHPNETAGMEAVEAGGGIVERRLEANGTATGVATVGTRVADVKPMRRSKGRNVAQVAAVLDKVLEQDVLVVEVEALTMCTHALHHGLAVNQPESRRRGDNLAQVLPEWHLRMVREREGLGTMERTELEHRGGRRRWWLFIQFPVDHRHTPQHPILSCGICPRFPSTRI